jgi:hypothetical protein
MHVPDPTSPSGEGGKKTVAADKDDWYKNFKMTYIPLALSVLSIAVAVAAYNDGSHHGVQRASIPEQAQFIDQKAFNVLPSVPPPSVANLTTVSLSVSRGEA